MSSTSGGAAPSQGCLVCASTRFAPWPAATRLANSTFDGEIVRCRDCGFCWMSPIPAEGVAAYEEDYFEAYEAAGQIMPAANAHAGALTTRIARIEELTGGPGRILDAGIGDGGFLRTAAARGWAVLGTDISAFAAARARKHHGIQVVEGALERVALPAGHFDAVHLSHVIEHVHDPVAALRNVRRSLRPGGWLIIEVPNEFTNGLTRVRLALGLAKRYSVRSTHVFFFDPTTLPKLLEARGFTVRSSRTFRETRVGGVVGRAVRGIVETIEQRSSGSPLLEVFAQSTTGSRGSDE